MILPLNATRTFLAWSHCANRMAAALCLVVGLTLSLGGEEIADPPSPAALPAVTVSQRSQPTVPVRLGVWARRNERNHATVKAAFRDVVAAASRSTVRVICDGQVKALGAVTHADGYVLTKWSELEGKELVCQLKDGRSLPAKVVGLDRDTDLAMLRVSANGLIPARFIEGDPPPVGSWLATPGLGDVPVAIGIVSAPQRRTDAPVGVLGVMLGDAEAGPRVDEVLPGSAALRHGVARGDVILRVNDQPTKTRRALVDAIRGHHPGEMVLLQVLRGDETMSIRARLRVRADNAPQGSLDHQNRMGGRISNRRTGFPLVLQHDSVLTPSDCGGPIVDLDGNVVGINIARAGRLASFSLPASLVVPLLDELKSGKLTPPRWAFGLWQSPQSVVESRIASLETTLREAERLRGEAERRLLQSETAVEQALVEKAVAELRKVDARDDAAAKLRAETQRLAAVRAVKRAEIPFEEARQEIVEVDQAISKINAALAEARQEQARLANSPRQE